MKGCKFFFVGVGLLFSTVINAQHPRLYATNADKETIQQKIKNEPWAKESWRNLLSSVDGYVLRHEKDPQWIVSRLAMYWKDGEHYTQCYLKNERWDYGEGNAPVPTVRMPGMRTWNEYVNVPLEDRMPFNETGNMKATSKTNPGKGIVVVPYKESGHLIRGNNVEILTLAEKAAFAYWMTGKEQYAKFASDIFNTWLIGTYYMEPIKDPGKSSKGIGGYEPGGILGYYDYEQIHDDLQTHAAPIYDFLYDYLQKHPGNVTQTSGKSYNEVAATVFKRFVEIGLVRGGKEGNWNINGFDVMSPSMMVLDDDNAYADKKGRQYYTQFYTSKTTAWHNSLPDILKQYSSVTGLWPESPGYALGTIGSLLNMAIPLYKSGINTIKENPLMQKAALAMFPWLDARGNQVVFGDMRGGPANFTALERLLTYYTWEKDTANSAVIADVIRKGIENHQYSRTKANWIGLCLNASLAGKNENVKYNRAAYSEVHRHLIMKNGNDDKNGLMFTLYGGYNNQRHLSPNGLAMQLYGKGWALAPDASGYESYWSADHAYHQTATGSNTILPGYTDGPITINAIEPYVDSLTFTEKQHLNDYCSFADVTAAEKRRLVAMIRTSETTGYYVDIFRSGLKDNDYLYHNLGDQLLLSDDNNKVLQFQPADDLDKNYNKAYSYFRHPVKALYNKGINARWKISHTMPNIIMDMWMKGEDNREVFKMSAPYTSIINAVTPNKVNVTPDSTWSVIVRQKNKDAFATPFVAVFEPYTTGNKSIKKITSLVSLPTTTCLLVESNSLNKELKGRKEYIIQSTDDDLHQVNNNFSFKGIFAVASSNTEGFQYLYLGSGKMLSMGDYSITADKNISASLINKKRELLYSATDKVKISLPNGKSGKEIYFQQAGRWEKAITTIDSRNHTISAFVPAGYDIKISIR